MMISSPSAADPYTAAAALDRALRSGNDAGPPSGDTPLDSGPDVVVTLGHGAATPATPATYDASGRMGGAPTLDALGANAPDSLAHASESDGGGDDAAPEAANAPAAPTQASVDEDVAVPA